jgi:hypothetical protein
MGMGMQMGIRMGFTKCLSLGFFEGWVLREMRGILEDVYSGREQAGVC